MYAKRVLWLFNDKLMVNIAENIGKALECEIYIPQMPKMYTQMVVPDLCSSINAVDREKLDKVDFYTTYLSKDIINLLNEYFDIIFIDVFSDCFNSIALEFKKQIVIVPYSTEYKNMTCSEAIIKVRGTQIYNYIQQNGDRFWLGSFGLDVSKEKKFLQSHVINLPLLFSDENGNSIISKEHEELLFICPEIKVDKRYRQLYEKAKKNIKVNSVVLGGKQSQNINTSWRQDCEALDEVWKYKFLLYYNNNYYLDDYVLNAMKQGVVVIHIGNGILPSIGCKQGLCQDTRTALRLYCKILKNKKLFEKIIFEQNEVIESMSGDKAILLLHDAFGKLVDYNKKNHIEDNEKKLAVLIPAEYRGGVLEYSINLVKALKRGSDLQGGKWKFVLGYLDSPVYEDEDGFNALRDEGIEIRPYKWEEFAQRRLQQMYDILDFAETANIKSKFMPNDNIRFFEDCDRFLFTSNHMPMDLQIMKPYYVILHDYIERYYSDEEPQIPFSILRKALCCFTTSEIVREDAVQYAGIAYEKIKLLPLFFNAVRGIDKVEANKKEYFIWPTNISKHKNHIKMLRALRKYYTAGGKLKCYMTGSATQKFLLDEDEPVYIDSDSKNAKNNNREKLESKVDLKKRSEKNYILKVRKIIENDPYLKKNIIIKGELPYDEYTELMEAAAFMIHPGQADNGNGAAFIAAMLNVPILSNRYGAMESIDRNLNLNMVFFDVGKLDEIKETLLYAETNQVKLREKMPNYETLLKHTIEDDTLCLKIYNTILGNSSFCD